MQLCTRVRDTIRTDTEGIATGLLDLVEQMLQGFGIRTMLGEKRNADAAGNADAACLQFKWSRQIGDDARGDLFDFLA